MWDRGLRVQNVSFINFPSSQTQALYGPSIQGRCSEFCGGEENESFVFKQITTLHFFTKKVG
jgi:hypothetical protein